LQTSIIIPAYNAQTYLPATLDSVLRQTCADWELVIVDDGSQDETPRLVQEYAARDRRIRGIRQANGNVAAARNRGFAESEPSSECIVFLDHDDVLEPDALQTLATALRANPEAVAAHGLARYIDSEGRPCRLGEAEAWTRDRLAIENNRLISWPLDRPTNFAVEAVVNRLFTPGQAMIRRRALEQVGPLDSEVVPNDDYDLWLRLTALGDMAFVDRVVLGFRQHAQNTSRHAGRMRRTEYLLRRKLLTSNRLRPEQRCLALLGMRLWNRRLAALGFQWTKDSLARRQWRSAAMQACRAARDYMLSASGLERTKRTAT
jgi:glycosyltransferase involved in cell wall biosynthesis